MNVRRMIDHHGSSSSQAQLGDLRLRRAARGVGQRRPPAGQRVVVVRARVDDAVGHVVLEAVRPVRVVGIEAPLHDDHAREAELTAQPRHGGGDDAEVLGDDRQLAELRARRRRTPPGPARAPSARRARPSRSDGTAQYATKPRKWSIRVTSNSANVRRSRSVHQR